MQVRVKELQEGKFGFYGTQRRYSGDIFDLDSESHFSAKWMEWVEPPKKKPGPKPKVETDE